MGLGLRGQSSSIVVSEVNIKMVIDPLGGLGLLLGCWLDDPNDLSLN